MTRGRRDYDYTPMTWVLWAAFNANALEMRPRPSETSGILYLSRLEENDDHRRLRYQDCRTSAAVR